MRATRRHNQYWMITVADRAAVHGAQFNETLVIPTHPLVWLKMQNECNGLGQYKRYSVIFAQRIDRDEAIEWGNIWGETLP